MSCTKNNLLYDCCIILVIHMIHEDGCFTSLSNGDN